MILFRDIWKDDNFFILVIFSNINQHNPQTFPDTHDVSTAIWSFHGTFQVFFPVSINLNLINSFLQHTCIFTLKISLCYLRFNKIIKGVVIKFHEMLHDYIYRYRYLLQFRLLPHICHSLNIKLKFWFKKSPTFD